jgi:hypothetical protein
MILSARRRYRARELANDDENGDVSKQDEEKAVYQTSRPTAT